MVEHGEKNSEYFASLEKKGLKQNSSRDLKLITKLIQIKQKYFQKLNFFIIFFIINGK